MNRNESFLRAICENPDDDTVRLVYADWLDEHGDTEQATFIRKQCELARVPEYDPLYIHCWHHECGWISGGKLKSKQPILSSGGLSWGPFAYRRGFLWRVKVLHLPAFLEHASNLFSLAPIQALDVDARTHPDLAPLASSPALSRLTNLEFSLGNFTEEQIRHLAESSYADRLSDLTFEFGGITGDGLRYLVHSTRSRQIRHLNLHSNFFLEFGHPVAAAFQGVQELPALVSLTLSGNRISRTPLLPIINGTRMPKLNTLDLGDNSHLGPDGVRALAESANLAGLTTLNLGKTNPGVEGTRALFQSKYLVNLHALNLAVNRLGPVTVRALAASPQFNKLRTLDLGHNPLGDKGALALARSQCLTGLLSLRLSDCNIEDAGAKALLESPTCANLIHFDLYQNHFSETVHQALKDRFGNRVHL